MRRHPGSGLKQCSHLRLMPERLQLGSKESASLSSELEQVSSRCSHDHKTRSPRRLLSVFSPSQCTLPGNDSTTKQDGVEVASLCIEAHASCAPRQQCRRLRRRVWSAVELRSVPCHLSETHSIQRISSNLRGTIFKTVTESYACHLAEEDK